MSARLKRVSAGEEREKQGRDRKNRAKFRVSKFRFQTCSSKVSAFPLLPLTSFLLQLSALRFGTKLRYKGAITALLMPLWKRIHSTLASRTICGATNSRRLAARSPFLPCMDAALRGRQRFRPAPGSSPISPQACGRPLGRSRSACGDRP